MPTLAQKPSLASTLLKAAWFSVILGLGMEVLILVIAAFFHNSIGVKAVVADLVQKISWSAIVCTGVAVGLGATRMRAQAMGVAGLIAAPVAFYSAKVLHKSVTQALALAPAAAAGPSPLLLAAIKGLEYAVLGYLVWMLGRRAGAKLRHHALLGLAVGVVFGGLIIYLTLVSFNFLHKKF
ncbi:MAG: hypothetical protein HY053_01370 [Proteobacteria bacterium]|nr:hypothetical protein [Pseudomonadota bacterium]